MSALLMYWAFRVNTGVFSQKFFVFFFTIMLSLPETLHYWYFFKTCKYCRVLCMYVFIFKMCFMSTRFGECFYCGDCKSKQERKDWIKCYSEKSGHHVLEDMRFRSSMAAHANAVISQVRKSCHWVWLNSKYKLRRSNCVVSQIWEY